jgi:protoheme IX farnesyltransferase
MAIASRPLVPSRLAWGHGDRTRPARSRAGAYIALTKPRIIELLLVTTVPTMVVARGGWPRWSLVALTLVGGTLAAGGANAFNMVADRDIDRLMQRTRNRPLVTGEVTPRAAFTFAVGLEAAAFAVLAIGVNLLSAVLALSATAFYVFVYTLWLKRTSRQNIVIGGAAGAVPVLVGWAAVTGSLGWAPWILFAMIFVWTPPHFWALAIKYADDYRSAGIPMLPAVAPVSETARQMLAYTAVLVALSLVLVPVAHLGALYIAVAALCGGVFLLLGVDLKRRPDVVRSMRLFSYSITYVTLLFVAMAVDVLIRA